MLSGVVDSNSILAGVISHFVNSSNVRVLDSILNREFTFITSEEVLDELAHVFRLDSSRKKHRMNDKDIDELCVKLRSVSRTIEPQRTAAHSFGARHYQHQIPRSRSSRGCRLPRHE